MVLGSLQYGGAEILNLCILQNINRDKYQIDFAVTRNTGTEIEKEVVKLGSKIHIVPAFSFFNILRYKKAWFDLLSTNDYDIVHGHASGAMSIYLGIAKKMGCKTVAHSHASMSSGNILVKLLKKALSIKVRKRADFMLACSDIAAKKLFGKKFKEYDNYAFVPNGIDASKFKFNTDIREQIRTSLGIKASDFLIGNVGRFTKQKNQKRLLDIYANVLTKEPNAYLLLCGDGPLKEELTSYVHKLGIENKVIFIGNVPNVNEYLQALDLFLLPSLFEGLPVSVVEAQAAGLPCLCSDEVTNEVAITDGTYFLPLSLPSEFWADKCIKLLKTPRDRINDYEMVNRSNFTINHLVSSITEVYDKIVS